MKEEELIDRIIDNVCELQGRNIAAEAMLEAMLKSHPDPSALHAHWHAISAGRIADTSTTRAMTGKPAAAAAARHLERWGEILARHHPG